MGLNEVLGAFFLEQPTQHNFMEVKMRTLPNFELRKALWKKGIKQVDMALDIEVDPSRISKIINGRERPTDEIKKAIADYLEMSLEELFY